MLIKESFLSTATNTDLLASPSRLAAIPRGGILTLQFTAEESSASSYFLLTIQTPEGDTPVEDFQIPANGQSETHSVMDVNTELRLQFTASQGGHFLISLTETGDTVCLAYASLVF